MVFYGLHTVNIWQNKHAYKPLPPPPAQTSNGHNFAGDITLPKFNYSTEETDRQLEEARKEKERQQRLNDLAFSQIGLGS